MRRRLTAAGAAALLALAAGGACGPDLSGPGYDAVAGAYALAAVDGAPLPVALEPGDCPLAITEGGLGLSPEGGDGRRPLYTVGVYARRACDPTRIPAGAAGEPVRDFGEWTVRADRVHFASERGYGAYAVPVDAAGPAGAPGPALTLRLGGRAYAFRRTQQGGGR